MGLLTEDILLEAEAFLLASEAFLLTSEALLLEKEAFLLESETFLPEASLLEALFLDAEDVFGAEDIFIAALRGTCFPLIRMDGIRSVQWL